MDFSLGSSFLNSLQAFISIQPSLIRAGSSGGAGPAFQEQSPALLPPPGKTGPHSDGTMPSAHHPETGLAGHRVGGEERRAVRTCPWPPQETWEVAGTSLQKRDEVIASPGANPSPHEWAWAAREGA